MSVHIAVDVDANWDKDHDAIDLPSFIQRVAHQLGIQPFLIHS
jgi:hypothetical protein